jgi:hypothetical protein
MDVVLIHGMGRTPLSMLRLRRRLRRSGHRAILFGYSPTFETLEGASARLMRLIERRIRGDYALVGHSLGSVIIRTALGQLQRPPAACCFLAPPMVACKAARYFSRLWLYRVMMGEMGQLLADDAFMSRLPLPAVPTRIYAGTAAARRGCRSGCAQRRHPQRGRRPAVSRGRRRVPRFFPIMHSKTVAASQVS